MKNRLLILILTLGLLVSCAKKEDINPKVVWVDELNIVMVEVFQTSPNMKIAYINKYDALTLNLYTSDRNTWITKDGKYKFQYLNTIPQSSVIFTDNGIEYQLFKK